MLAVNDGLALAQHDNFLQPSPAVGIVHADMQPVVAAGHDFPFGVGRDPVRRRVLLAAEGEAQEVAAQDTQQPGQRHVGFLRRPRGQRVGGDRPLTELELDRSQMPATDRQPQSHPIMGESPARLTVDKIVHGLRRFRKKLTKTEAKSHSSEKWIAVRPSGP